MLKTKWLRIVTSLVICSETRNQVVVFFVHGVAVWKIKMRHSSGLDIQLGQLALA